MKEKAIRNILIAWGISAIGICALKILFCNSDLCSLINGLLTGVSIIAGVSILAIAISGLLRIRESNEAFFKLWEQGDMNACISFAECELNKNIAAGFTLNTKKNLVMAYYRIGRNESGRRLLYETNWGNYKGEVLYFFFLDSMACGNLPQAKKYYRQLCHTRGKRIHQQQIENCRGLLSSVEKQNISELPTISSIYPIVGEILKKQKSDKS